MSSVKAVICVPTFNRESRLAGTLTSILAQTLTDFRLIVVDNASTDSTPEILGRIRDPRFRCVRNPFPLDMTANWNRCLEIALQEPAEFIAIYHSDDYYAPTILEREVRFLDSRPEAGLVHTAMQYYAEKDGRRKTIIPYPADRVLGDRDLLDDLCRREIYHISTPTVLARSEVYRKAGYFDPHFKICPDLDLWWRMLSFTKLGYIAEPLFAQTIHQDQVSSSPEARKTALTQAESMEAVLRALRRMRARYPDLDATARECDIRRYFAHEILRMARSELLRAHRAGCGEACREAVALSPTAGIRAQALLLQSANNPVGRRAAAAAAFLYRNLLEPSRGIAA